MNTTGTATEKKLVRLWDKSERKWLENFAITNKGKIMGVAKHEEEGFGLITFIAEASRFIRNNAIQIEDKHQNEIFEDDIVIKRYDDGKALHIDVGVVKYVAPYYALVTEVDIIPLSSCDDLEIIGNLRETPEKFSGKQHLLYIFS